MTGRRFNLAIETSGQTSSVCLGCGDQVLATRALTRSRRHNVDLMPAIEALFREQCGAPGDLAEIYISLGPGSFTGLRVGVATAKMLALSTGARLVGVPTLDVLARNAPADVEHLGVALNLKRDAAWSAVFDRHRRVVAPPALRTISELLAAAPPGSALLGEALPDLSPELRVLPSELTVACSEAVYAVGRELAGKNHYADPVTIAPLYARQPEAVTLWNQREAQAAVAPDP